MYIALRSIVLEVRTVLSVTTNRGHIILLPSYHPAQAWIVRIHAHSTTLASYLSSYRALYNFIRSRNNVSLPPVSYRTTRHGTGRHHDEGEGEGEEEGVGSGQVMSSIRGCLGCTS